MKDRDKPLFAYQKANFCPCFNVVALFIKDQVHLGELTVSQIFTSKKEGFYKESVAWWSCFAALPNKSVSGLFAEQLVSHSSLLFFGTGEVDRNRISRLIQCRPVDLFQHTGVAVLCWKAGSNSVNAHMVWDWLLHLQSNSVDVTINNCTLCWLHYRKQ